MSIDLAPVGLAVGHAQDEGGGTGVTVIRGDTPFRCGVTVLGRATGTRELELLGPRNLVDRVDAIMLAGGSAYGLEAAHGVMRWMEERERGFGVQGGVVPIVPAAVIFDLGFGLFGTRPTPAMGYEACDRAVSTGIAEGSVGAGTGATVGKALGRQHAMKGGFGCWVERSGSLAAAAMVVVNALGDVRDADGRIIAGARRAHGGGFADAEKQLREARASRGVNPFQQTTLAVVATSAGLDRAALSQLSTATTSALYRRITPVGTSFDGDVVFAVAPVGGASADALHVETLATRALEIAIERAVLLARGTEAVPGAADRKA